MSKQDDSEPRVDRTAFSVFDSFDEAEAADDACWRSRTPAERLAHLELLRRINYGDAATRGIEKVLEITWADRVDPKRDNDEGPRT